MTMTILRTLSLSRPSWRLAALLALTLAALLLPSIAQAQSHSLTATVNNDRSVDLTLSNAPSNWWFRINSWGTCTAVSGNSINGIQGYKAGTHSVSAYSDSNCGSQIAVSSFTIPSTSISAVVNNDHSVTLTLAGGPSNWWFRINSGGTCTSATGNTVSNIQGYKAGTYHTVVVYSDGNCQYLITHTQFVIPTATLATAVNNDRSVDLTLTDGPNNWWFRIGGGTCTAASGTTVSGIQGYKAGTHSVNAYSDSSCGSQIAASSFTIPNTSVAAVVNNDRSVTLTLTDGPGNWWFRINLGGTCTAASGTTVSNINGYQSGVYHTVVVL